MTTPDSALLRLVPEPGEDPRSPEFQAEATQAAMRLKTAGVTARQRAMAFDAVGVSGYPLADFTIEFTKAVAPIVTGICSVIIVWLQTRPGRKVRFGKDGSFLEFDRATDAKLIEQLIRDIMDKDEPKP